MEGSFAPIFAVLPDRNPEEHLNMSKHIVSWVELPLMVMGFFVLVLTGMTCLISVAVGSQHHWKVGQKVVDMMRHTATFLVLSSLPAAHLMTFARQLYPLFSTTWPERIPPRILPRSTEPSATSVVFRILKRCYRTITRSGKTNCLPPIARHLVGALPLSSVSR